MPDIINAVQQQSTVNPSGGIGTEPAPKGQEFTYTVRSQGRLVSAEEFGNVVVRLNPDGSVVRLKDVSRIDLGALNYQQRSRLNGKLWEELSDAEHRDFPGDYEAQVSQGAIAWHSEEHLATSDRGITMLRRVLQRQLEAVRAGDDPAGVSHDPHAPPVRFEAGNYLVPAA